MAAMIRRHCSEFRQPAAIMKRRLRRILGIAAACAFLGCNAAAQEPCKLTSIGTGDVAATRDGRTLLLSDGREVRLAEPAAGFGPIPISPLCRRKTCPASKPCGVSSRWRKARYCRCARVGPLYVNFGRRWTRDFTVIILRRLGKAFTTAGVEPKKLEGRRIRVRGWIEQRGGPIITAEAPEQIEVLD